MKIVHFQVMMKMNDSATKDNLLSGHHNKWIEKIKEHHARMPSSSSMIVEGKITRMVGMTIEALGCQAAVGVRCEVENQTGESIEAEVVGFNGDRLYLMPTGSIQGIQPNARVIPSNKIYEVAVGDNLLGRVLDGTGRPLDDKGHLNTTETVSLNGKPINPLDRAPITEPLDVGVRSINSLLSVGRGQRLGLFAGSGVGKSVLLGMMTRYTTADVIVVGLIGERGREVKDFINNILGEEGMARAVVVAVPADQTPVMRLHGAFLATSIAEYFRDQGKNVLLLMDSLTRFAQAQREIALAIGEPPATKGYPPSVFGKLPQLVERAGNGEEGKGSITAFYTVLTEGDDQMDPIADASRAILDGHIVLSRELAESGHFPAVDVEASISRAMVDIISKDHLKTVQRFKQMYSTYKKNEDLITIGAYTPGSDSRVDQSIVMQPAFMEFLKQDMDDPTNYSKSLERLDNLFEMMEQAQTAMQTTDAFAPLPETAQTNLNQQDSAMINGTNNAQDLL